MMRYAVLFEKTATGYSAHVPDLPGCVAAGTTIEETAGLMRKAMQMHLAGMREDGDPIPSRVPLPNTSRQPEISRGRSSGRRLPNPASS